MSLPVAATVNPEVRRLVVIRTLLPVWSKSSPTSMLALADELATAVLLAGVGSVSLPVTLALFDSGKPPLTVAVMVTTLVPLGARLPRLQVTTPALWVQVGLVGTDETKVTPAGKATRRLSLLSGGEKSLVALAFVFSVFLARPSPFYILDEVEAALDDANIDRFLQLVRRFSDRAQFVIVTHQKRTMDAADVLYGVSMQDGATKVIVKAKVGPATTTR